jgi:sulfate adenylyltransferase
MVDNTLSPHGGTLVDRVIARKAGAEKIRGLKSVAIRDQIARECVGIAYGFFSPIEGFMGREDVDAVANDMQLASGYVWSIPIVFDMSPDEISELSLKEGDVLLLTHEGQPVATLDVEEIYSYNKEQIAQKVYGTTDEKHPGVQRTYAYKDKFLSGKITLVNPPLINPPFDEFWYPPKVMRERFAEKGWEKVAAHQSRNVPHAGHEWLMKGAWFAANADAVLVNAVIGEKKLGDFIDEAIILAHDMLRTAGYFKEEVHMTSILQWDMRYAGPREAVFHAIVRKNLGCTHHMFGRDHAGVGSYYDPYAAHRIFDEIPDIGIKPVVTGEWWNCPVCAGIAYEGLCDHRDQKQDLSGTLMRQTLEGGVTPSPLIFRAEVFELVMECAKKYGFDSPFVSENYLRNRNPVMTFPPMDSDG